MIQEVLRACAVVRLRYPDTLALASQLARERGEHSTAKLLSVTDVDYRPPSEAARLELESGA